MKESVWLFLWFLDKMTSISEEGVGKVLGGKPITYEEVSKDLGLTLRTYRRYIATLKKHSYINVTRTPYGLSISVNKAQKTYNQKTKETDMPNSAHQEPKMAHLDDKNGTSNIRQDSRQDNKTTIDTDVAIIAGTEVNDLLYEFRHINPSYQKLFSNKTERKALEEMITKYTYQKVASMLARLPELVVMPYAPRITTPITLQRKLGELIIFMKQEKGKEVKNDKYRGIDSSDL